MRVLIADGHAVFRLGVKETLARAFTKLTFGEARTAQEVFEQARGPEWDLVILDVDVLVKSGLDILDHLRLLRPQLPILLLSARAGKFVRQALKAGAAGYLTKDCSPEELNEAVKKILAGGRYVSVSARDLTTANLHELLSKSEFQVLRMIALGSTLTEVAKELSLSVKTVSTYRARIREKTGLRTNAQLIRYALQTQLVD